MFHKDKKFHKDSLKKIDAVITGLLLGGVVASIYGIKKHKHHEVIEQGESERKKMAKKVIKMLIFGCEEEKP